MPTNLKGTYIRTSDSILNLLHHRASLSGLPLSQFLVEKALSDGLSFDSQLRHFIQRIAFESFIIREELPNFAKSIYSLNKLLSSDAGHAGDTNLASDELKPPFNDALKLYMPSLANPANQPTSSSPSSPSSPSSTSSPHSPSSSSSSSSIKLQQLLSQLPLLFDKLAFSTEFLISLFGNIKCYPDILRNLHSICDRNPHVLSASLLFDFSPSSTSFTAKASHSFISPFSPSATHSYYGSYSQLPNFAFLTLAPSSWAFSSASLLKSKASGSDLSLLKSQAYSFSLGHPYSLYP